MTIVVIATNSDHESWAYGPFATYEKAEDFAANMAEAFPQIDYQTSTMTDPTSENPL